MKRISLLLLFMLSVATMRAQLTALKTNLLKDAAASPNLTLEVALNDKLTLGCEVSASWSMWGLRMRNVGVAPELRWWFGGRTFDRYFLGGGVRYIHYDMEWKHQLRRGDAAGAGLTFGYDLYLTKHLNLEFAAGLGAMYFEQRHWYEGDTEVPLTYTERGIRFVPYQTGVTLVWVFGKEAKNRKQSKKHSKVSN